MGQMKTGAILSYLLIFLNILIALIYTPVMLRLLGQEEFGLYALIGSIIAYFSILDMGLGNTIVRYTARNRVIGDKRSEYQLNGLFLLLFIIIGLVTIFIGFTFYNSIEYIFGNNLSSLEVTKAKVMVVIITITFAISFPLSVFSSILQAYEKFVVIKLVNITRALMVPVLSLPFLLIGYGSVTLVLITSLITIACLLFNVYYSYKTIRVKFKFGKIDLKLLKEILGYSFFVFLGVIVDQIYWNTGQFILGIIAGTVPVAIYAIAMQFIKLYMQFSTAISGLFLPKASKMVANNTSNEILTNNMIRYGRIQLLILGLIISGFIIYGFPFINFWAGNDYEDVYFITLIIMIPLTIPLIQNFGIAVLYAKNMQKFRSAILIFIAIINVGLSFPLASTYGVYGIATATSISLTLGNILLMNFYYHYKIGINMLQFWKEIIKLIFPIILLTFVVWLQHQFLPYPSLILLILYIILYIGIYAVVSWKFSMNSYEKKLLSTLIIKVSKLLKITY